MKCQKSCLFPQKLQDEVSLNLIFLFCQSVSWEQSAATSGTDMVSLDSGLTLIIFFTFSKKYQVSLSKLKLSSQRKIQQLAYFKLIQVRKKSLPGKCERHSYVMGYSNDKQYLQQGVQVLKRYRLLEVTIWQLIINKETVQLILL